MKPTKEMIELAKEAGMSSDALFEKGNGYVTVIYILLYKIIDLWKYGCQPHNIK
jgi:hypothetical protein